MLADKKDYWRWPEQRWTSPDIDWKQGKCITAGVDVGTVSTQAAIMVDGKLYAYSNMRTGAMNSENAGRAIKWALESTGLAETDLKYTVGTGYGKANIHGAGRTITDVACHSLGANFMYGPSVRTVVDAGGLDLKIIHCDEKGRVVNSARNDKCAAGTGRGMEVFADLISVPIQDIGDLSFRIDKEPEALSGTCAVSAKTEALVMLHKGRSVEMVLAAYCASMADRIIELLRRHGCEKDIVFTGGQSKNIGITRRVEKQLGITALKTSDIDPQITGAIGAALFAKALLEKL